MPNPLKNRHPQQRRGFVVLYACVLMVVLCAMVSLAVDLGRAQLVKTELQRAADAAARYAASGISNSTYVERAQIAAAENLVDGTPLIIQSQDILTGNWDPERTPNFDPDRTPTNAIQITALRHASRGTAVPLVFAKAVGMPSLDLEATAIVMIDRGTDVTGLVGVDSISMNGSTIVDSYDSTYGAYPAGAGEVSLASNGDIYLYDTATVTGGAHPGPGGQVHRDAGVSVGSTSPLSEPMTHPAPDPGSYATSNDNSNVPPAHRPAGNFRMSGNQTLTLPGGNYYFHDFDMSGTSQLTLTGPATFWITGEVKAAGTMMTSAGKPANLKFRVIGSGEVTFSGNATLMADVYAPQSDVTINGNPDFSGALVGRTLNIIGNARIHFDRALSNAEPIAWSVYATVK